MSYGFLGFADCLAVLAMVAIAFRLVADHASGQLAIKDLLVGGMFFAVIFGLFLAGAQMLLAGPGL